MGLDYAEKKCVVCGKRFVVYDPNEYVFKRHISGTDRYFCSWSHIREFDKNRGSKGDRREKIISMLNEGKSVDEVSKTLHAEKSCVRYWQRKLQEAV